MTQARETRRPAARLMALLLVPCLAGVAVAAQLKKSDAVVKVTVKGDKPDAAGKQVVTVVLDIDKGWHAYANPVGQDDLKPVQTTVGANAKVKPEAVQIDYPEGKLVKDAVVGNYRVYEGKVTLKGTVTRAKGDDSPLEVTVKFQACSDKTCLQPATVKKTVP